MVTKNVHWYTISKQLYICNGVGTYHPIKKTKYKPGQKLELSECDHLFITVGGDERWSSIIGLDCLSGNILCALLEGTRNYYSYSVINAVNGMFRKILNSGVLIDLVEIDIRD